MSVLKSEETCSEKELIAEILAGNKELFAILVARYKDLVFSMIMHQVGHASIAEDLAQETFFKAYRNLKSFRFEARFSTWLTRIALNETSSYFASRRFREARKTEQFDPVLRQHNPGTKGLDEEESLIKKLRQALAELKPPHREVVVLCSLEGKSYEEAAQILDIPAGTVKSRLNKARLLLKEYFLEDR